MKNGSGRSGIIIIGGPRKYKETGPLTEAGYSFGLVEYRDTGPGRVIRMLRALKATADASAADVIFSDMLNVSGIFVLLFARVTGRKLILRIRGEKFSQERTSLPLLFREGLLKEAMHRFVTFHLSSFVIRRADALMPDSEFGKLGMLLNTDIPPERIRVVPIPVRFKEIEYSVAEIAAARRNLDIEQYSNVLLTVTGFSYAEKIRGLREALPQLAAYLNSRQDTVFIIAGGGPLTGLVERTVKRYASPHIRLTGFIADVRPLYAVCTVFTHFSYQDGCPNIILEAMLAEKPVVTNDFISFRNRIDEGVNGFIIDLHNPAALAAVIDRLISDPELRTRLGGEGRRKVLHEHNEQAIGRRLAAALDELGEAVRSGS
ncbi:glycosyltransferase family 4 protein [bacterium]|nr:glycosyltransferase family 4 protein [bacterium]